ncbi:MAG TPA: GNAT family N-acetyltransferase [Pseudomonadales bacterium]|nr:GNAT family N-acetyltransferase [Pseudomonadales bacterium]
MSKTNPRVDLRPIAADELDAFFAHMQAQYVGERMQADGLDRVEAETLVAEQRRATLPNGIATPDQHLLWGVDAADDRRVGLLWIALDARYHHAFIYQIFVFEPLRRHGYGRALLDAAEAFARSRGARTIDLNVFTPNRGAIALYESAGFAPTSQHMSKPL